METLEQRERRKRKIYKQEQIDRYIAEQILTDYYTISGYTVSSTGTPIQCAVDIETKITSTDNSTYHFYTEVKERKKDQSGLDKWGYVVELKEEKLKNIKAFTKGKNVLYISLYHNMTTNDRTAYIFYLNKIDFRTITCYPWEIKKTQYSETSEKEFTMTYMIPMELAKAKVPWEKYYFNLPPHLEEYRQQLENGTY